MNDIRNRVQIWHLIDIHQKVNACIQGHRYRMYLDTHYDILCTDMNNGSKKTEAHSIRLQSHEMYVIVSGQIKRLVTIIIKHV